MKTIYKLILKSYLGPMIMTFFIVMFVLMMNFVWRYIDELVGKGLSAGIIIELMAYARRTGGAMRPRQRSAPATGSDTGARRGRSRAQRRATTSSSVRMKMMAAPGGTSKP